MKLFCVLLLLAAGVSAQKAETMTIKVYFHSTKIDPDWDSCVKVYPVSRTVPKTPAVATAALQEFLKGPTPSEEKEFSGFGPRFDKRNSKKREGEKRSCICELLKSDFRSNGE